MRSTWVGYERRGHPENEMGVHLDEIHGTLVCDRRIQGDIACEDLRGVGVAVPSMRTEPQLRYRMHPSEINRRTSLGLWYDGPGDHRSVDCGTNSGREGDGRRTGPTSVRLDDATLVRLYVDRAVGRGGVHGATGVHLSPGEHCAPSGDVVRMVFDVVPSNLLHVCGDVGRTPLRRGQPSAEKKIRRPLRGNRPRISPLNMT